GVMPSPGCVFALEQRRWPEMGYARFARFCTGFALWYGLRPFVRSLRSLLYEEGTLPKRAERAYQSERSERAKANAVSVQQVSEANELPIRAAPPHESTTLQQDRARSFGGATMP